MKPGSPRIPRHVRDAPVPVSITLMDLYARLSRHFGPTRWWPGDTPFEIAVGAILTQNTAWTNVERAIENLKGARLLTPRALLECAPATLEIAIRPSGYFRQKAERLRIFSQYLVEHYGGSMRRMAKQPLDSLRLELLALKGIGPETADDILLYACEKPVFVVDAYTRRILHRHGLAGGREGYEALRAFMETHLPLEVPLFMEYHGLVVYAGKAFCRKTPCCQGCPLEPVLKPGQPVAGPDL